MLLTGHCDTVTAAKYGDLAPLATQLEALATALIERVQEAAPRTVEGRCREDLDSERLLPERGPLDMKAGLAAGPAAVARFPEDGAAVDNLLFLAVPDEESASAGARAAATALAGMAAGRGLEVRAAVNLDAIAAMRTRPGAGGGAEDSRQGAAHDLVGAPAHEDFLLRGVNAAALAAAVTQAVEWHRGLTDAHVGAGDADHRPHLKDGK